MPEAWSYCEDLCCAVVLCLKLLWQNIKKGELGIKNQFLGHKECHENWIDLLHGIIVDMK